jgi:hypothetical protein
MNMKQSHFRMKIVATFGGIALMASFSSLLFAQTNEDESTQRGIVAEEFVKARPAKHGAAAKIPTYTLVGASSKTVSMASLRTNSAESRELGITVWRLRPAISADGGPRILVQEGADTVSWTPERVPSDTPLRQGDRVRLSIESPRTGYLYVIDREQYAGKQQGDAYLIFPTTRTNNGDNKVTAGRLVEIPAQEDRPNYFTLKQSRPDQSGEVLSVIVTDKPLEDVTIGDKPIALSAELVSKWEHASSSEIQRFEMTGGAGKTWTKAEQEAGLDGTRLLTQDDPGPQTIYRVTANGDEPILVKVGLKYRAASRSQKIAGTDKASGKE